MYNHRSAIWDAPTDTTVFARQVTIDLLARSQTLLFMNITRIIHINMKNNILILSTDIDINCDVDLIVEAFELQKYKQNTKRFDVITSNDFVALISEKLKRISI